MKKSLLSEITRAVKAVTSVEIERARKDLVPLQEGEALVLVIEDDEAIRLWTLAHNYERQYALAMHAARFNAGSHQERQEILREAARTQQVEEIVRSLAWRQIEDLAGPSVRDDEAITAYSLRENFTLASCPPEPAQPKSGLQVIPFPHEMMSRLYETLRKRYAEENESQEPKKPKPQ